MNKIIVSKKENLISKHRRNGLYEYNKYEVTKREENYPCYVCIYEILPKKANYPYHYHTNNTEVFYIINGKGILETPDGVKEIKSGDVIVLPPNSEGAHRMVNTSENENLVYLDCATNQSPDVVFYPNSKKIGVIVHKQESKFFKSESTVDYYDGE